MRGPGPKWSAKHQGHTDQGAAALTREQSFARQRLARLAAQPSFRCAPSLCEAWVTNRS